MAFFRSICSSPHNISLHERCFSFFSVNSLFFIVVPVGDEEKKRKKWTIRECYESAAAAKTIEMAKFIIFIFNHGARGPAQQEQKCSEYSILEFRKINTNMSLGCVPADRPAG